MIRSGFILAGLVNILGILLVTHGMQNETLSSADPAVFSDFGILMIMVWGLAYIASADAAKQLVWLPLVFALEKAAYTVNWILWFKVNQSQLSNILQIDPLGGLFLGGYGINDGLFGLFFLWVAWHNWRRSAEYD